jgi:predicted nucleic acid-binding protein
VICYVQERELSNTRYIVLTLLTSLEGQCKIVHLQHALLVVGVVSHTRDSPESRCR